MCFVAWCLLGFIRLACFSFVLHWFLIAGFWFCFKRETSEHFMPCRTLGKYKTKLFLIARVSEGALFRGFSYPGAAAPSKKLRGPTFGWSLALFSSLVKCFFLMHWSRDFSRLFTTFHSWTEWKVNRHCSHSHFLKMTFHFFEPGHAEAAFD